MSTAAERLPRDEADPSGPLRFISAASLFDGHDAAINIIRRILQAHGAEVIHLGHNRSVADIVRAAIQEDADGIAVSSYQGGHNEYFRYMIDMLREQDAAHIRVVVGGGGTIAPDEIEALEAYGVEKIYSPDDGMRLGLDGMIEDVLRRIRSRPKPAVEGLPATAADDRLIGRAISLLEGAGGESGDLGQLRAKLARPSPAVPVIGVTGTGGAGKSSLTDELLNRLLRQFPERRIAVVAMDPTRRRSGGALLGDRIRMNSLASPRIFMRSLATRRQNLATSAILAETLTLLSAVQFDLIVVETAGIGQSDSEIVDLADVTLYVMTSEYGAASQLEKIDMLDFADFIALNKFEKRGGEDALRDVRKQWRRNHPQQMKIADSEIPVYPTIASQFNDAGVNRLFSAICRRINAMPGAGNRWATAESAVTELPRRHAVIPGARVRYLAEIAEDGRAQRESVAHRSEAASRAHGLYRALGALAVPGLPAELERYTAAPADASVAALGSSYNAALDDIGAGGIALLKEWPARARAATGEHYVYQVRGQKLSGDNYTTSLSRQKIPKIAVPHFRDWGDTLAFLLAENLPGGFPYTAGVYPYRREEEDPIRMFAGEGTPERTNRRFHYLALGHEATRLSTAFDSTTLYGEDPDERPDIYGRIGNSGVSIATLDDMKKLYSGFDLCAPTTSVSMTINGPAPMILAMFMNTAIDQRIERHLIESGQWPAAQKKIAALYKDRPRPTYSGKLPEGSDGFGLKMLGITGDQLVERDVYEKIRAEALALVRGTVQADILKEDQAQNTCIFSTEFALRVMGDVQAYFIDKAVRNFYSVSISGYHIAEAGANPVTQLAFTLANGFTIVEYYLARGMRIDDFAPNLSFFFSNGMDPEYAVIGRVARRIWARAMRDLYVAGPRSQMLKYHIQTSGRSLHAREIQFNDIRTTLQALYALFDNCNSLHTNAYDEAITTPTEESVRRAVAIQLVINRELGLNKTQNPWQGSFAIEQLTDLVEEAVYQEFEHIADRGGVLGAMETMYQRGRIQEESLYYEQKKHDGTLPIVGVNMFLPAHRSAEELRNAELIRSTDEEKRDQVRNVRVFLDRHRGEASSALERLQRVAAAGGNVFGELMESVKVASLGSISHALYEVGGQYRRNM
ncbi:MAG TPA: methylmalonyl-CoA mutase family protein [Steroidobacteraceae bacterium]|nr:methylmalonyl-CoA mutase family protein [Steroidobacteraceae bacterium]